MTTAPGQDGMVGLGVDHAERDICFSTDRSAATCCSATAKPARSHRLRRDIAGQGRGRSALGDRRSTPYRAAGSPARPGCPGAPAEAGARSGLASALNWLRHACCAPTILSNAWELTLTEPAGRGRGVRHAALEAGEFLQLGEGGEGGDVADQRLVAGLAGDLVVHGEQTLDDARVVLEYGGRRRIRAVDDLRRPSFSLLSSGRARASWSWNGDSWTSRSWTPLERGEGLVRRPPRGDHATLLDGAVTATHPADTSRSSCSSWTSWLRHSSDGGLVGRMLGLHLASQAGTNTDRSQNRQRDQRSNPGSRTASCGSASSGSSAVHCLSGGSHRWHESLRRASLDSARPKPLVWIIGGKRRILPRRAYGLISRPTDHVISANLISPVHAARLSSRLITVQVGRPGPPPLSP